MDQVVLDQHGVAVNGKRTILLCASLFYFRIPRAEWEDRILKLKAAGYNCVDVYFPWNFHETAPGQWDFSEEKDAEAYLDLLRKHGMYVIARPGPYICSEWDGGAIPAWVLTDSTLKIRENDPVYLAAVRDWYNHILPVIASHQISKGGTVILMQLENELDFYDCRNPRAYMEALRDMAREAGIAVPVFGCAGQANVEGATGWANGVDVSFNFYGEVSDPTYGEKFHYYAERMGELNRPLLISETSCDHLLLRRELAAGAKLLGPYNQVGGTNFGFTGSLNNWGTRENPASFITTYYTGDGMIGSAGELHPQYFEGRLLGGLVQTFGEALAGAQSVEDKELSVSCTFPTNSVFYRLKLVGGGSLVCVPNLGEQSGKAKISCAGIRAEVTAAGYSAPFFPMDVPLSLFGGNGTLLTADGELENTASENGELVLTFWTESDAPFAAFEVDGKSFRLTKENPSASGVRAVFARERELRAHPLSGVEVPVHMECSKLVPTGSLTQMSLSGELRNRISYRPGSVQPLERCGVYRGMGGYRFHMEGLGVLLLGGCDIVSVYRNDRLEEAYANAGGTRYISGDGQYEVIAAIWGHSNFADARQPALMLNSAKGLSKAVEVHKTQELEDNWFFSYYEGLLPDSLRIPQRAVETLLPINSWNTTRTPLRAVYRKTIRLDESCDSFVLELQNSSTEATLYVDGERVGLVNPLDPFLDVSQFLFGKKTAELEFCVTKRDWNEPVGCPVLYSGREVRKCEFAPLPEEKLTEAICGLPLCGHSGSLPLRLESGAIVTADFPLEPELSQSVYLRIKGKNIFAAVWAENRLLGRALLWEKSPKMCGEEELVYLPKSYHGIDGNLRFLIASLDKDSELSSVTLESIQ